MKRNNHDAILKNHVAILKNHDEFRERIFFVHAHSAQSDFCAIRMHILKNHQNGHNDS